MFGFASVRSRLRHTARQLYGSSVTASRAPEFYVSCGVPDTAEGRFEMLILHLFLVQERLKAAGEAGAGVGRALAEEFVAEMDNALREMGVGDMGIPRRVKQAAEAYNGRLIAYEKAAAEADLAALQAALSRNVYAGTAPEFGPGTLLSYVRAAREAVRAQSTDAIVNGVIAFPAPPASAGPQDSRVERGRS